MIFGFTFSPPETLGPYESMAEPCPECGFQGAPALVEELAYIDWLLEEVMAWPALSAGARHCADAAG